MSINSSLSALPANRFDRAAARHLLLRSGFGGTPAQVSDLLAKGLHGAVDHVVSYQSIPAQGLPQPEIDEDVIAARSDDERDQLRKARRAGDQDTVDAFRKTQLDALREDGQMFRGLQEWWYQRMVATPRPAEERLTLLWHGHFATSQRVVRDSYLMYKQNQMFREHANGSFADLARGIVRDPAMIKYLNNDRNIARSPNENLARELMELFTLGEGHYSEQDIKQGARALTGYTYDDNDFVFRENRHDDGTKQILGQSGTFDGDDFVSLLLRRRECARFVALKLYDHFVADVGDDGGAVPRVYQPALDALADLVIKHEYELQPVLSTLLKSRHFYDPQIVGRKIKDPTQLAVGTIRSLGTPTRNDRYVIRSLASMGQVLFEPPSVNGWDGGRSWINTSTLFVRQNLTTYLISGKDPSRPFNRKAVGYDPFVLLAELDQPSDTQAVDYLIDHMVGADLAADRRATLHRFMADRKSGLTVDSLVALLCVITAMPEYQLC